MIDWQRKRLPEDVPTPVAVAVSDFCRRARAPAPPAVIREALSLLTDEDDAQVRALADAEPPALPLGPFAVVDLIAFHTEPATAAQRQQAGYYDQVLDAARKQPEQKQPVARAAETPVLVAEPPSPKLKSAKKPAATAAPKPTKKAESLKATVAPKVREHGDRRRSKPPEQVYGTSFLPKRSLPAPRGRFTRIDSSRSPYELLLRLDAKELLASLVEQVPHRIALLRTLDQGYSGRAGQVLTLDEVLVVLERHGFTATMAARERDVVLSAITDARGSFAKAAHALGMKDDELTSLIEALKLTREATEIRDRFTREALSPRNLSLRLDLLTRKRYLEDLGMEDKFREVLERDLRKMIDSVRDAVHSVPELVDVLCRQHALQPDALRKALETLGLAQTFLTTPSEV